MSVHQFTIRHLEDGRRLDVVPQTFGKFRLCLAPSRDSMFYDDSW